jgi:hypothetical protein
MAGKGPEERTEGTVSRKTEGEVACHLILLGPQSGPEQNHRSAMTWARACRVGSQWSRWSQQDGSGTAENPVSDKILLPSVCMHGGGGEEGRGEEHGTNARRKYHYLPFGLAWAWAWDLCGKGTCSRLHSEGKIDRLLSLMIKGPAEMSIPSVLGAELLDPACCCVANGSS